MFAFAFPNLALPGYRIPFPPSIASNDVLFDDLMQMAKANEIDIDIDIAVGFCEQDDSNHYITHMLITQNVNSQCYRKMHLGEKESKHFTAGDELMVFSLRSGIRIGFSICIESHIPQVSETLAHKGAHIIFSPPMQYQNVWEAAPIFGENTSLPEPMTTVCTSPVAIKWVITAYKNMNVVVFVILALLTIYQVFSNIFWLN